MKVKSSIITMLSVAVTIVTAQAQALARELNWKTYKEVRDYASRKPSDLHYLSVPWKDTVFDGLVAAQKEDKPILLWLYFGDGRGRC